MPNPKCVTTAAAPEPSTVPLLRRIWSGHLGALQLPPAETAAADEMSIGRHRLKACDELGIEPRFSAFEGTEGDAVFEVGSLNAARRNLSKAQLTMFGLKLKEQHAVLAKQRQLDALQTSSKRNGGMVVARVPPPIDDVGKSRDLAAKAVGVGGSEARERGR
jgi:hypothetical protein